ncbi:MAG: riboflavin synthase, partial [Candidatus Latescibacteria bacterium]|nr:riboflavin synthase [Candidatus Latescibacterota bacterium]
ERSLRLGDRLGGHLVQGHVDGTGRITSRKGTSGNVLLGIAPEPGLEHYIAEKGSVAVDGVSLTVTFAKKGEFGVSIIPHTLQATTLEKIRSGDIVNLETDIIAKYVEKLLGRGGSLTLSNLEELGF